MVESPEAVFFADEPEGSVPSRQQSGGKGAWKVLVVDDEEEVHAVTKLVLADFSYENKGLLFLHAYSGKEARALIAEHPDTAIIFLDVVMEKNDAGLEVVRHIREELKNSFVRIILRTGQPGQAPAEKVIIEYDINDYKEKTELTAQKLFTTMVASLRSYRDILTIDANRKGLEKIIDAATYICRLRSIKNLASGVLTQLVSILHLSENALYCQTSGIAVANLQGNFKMLAATGAYEPYIDAETKGDLPDNVLDCVQQVTTLKKSICLDNRYIGYFCSERGEETVIYLEGWRDLSVLDRRMIEVFCSNVQVAYENVLLNQEIEGTQKEIIYTLGQLAEMRSLETGNHVHRVAEYSRLLAEKHGLSQREVEVIRLASSMHDVGKVAIPDAILNKTGPLSPAEFEVMKTHTIRAQEMLGLSDREIVKAAIVIAMQHHEKFDGSGYPKGLKGEEIHISARITAIADVFDALGSDRSYRQAWEMEAILDLIRTERGAHFDPVLVDLFFENIEAILAIKITLAE
jgi:response regulator RpfG family c-di-GMP phosphodiesterase